MLVPAPGVFVLGLFLDGALVEFVDDPLDVLGYLRASADFRRAPRTRSQALRTTSATSAGHSSEASRVTPSMARGSDAL